MTVAYYLILDNKRRKQLSTSPIMHATAASAAAADPSQGSTPEQQALAQQAAPPQPMAMPPAMLPAPQLAQAARAPTRCSAAGTSACRHAAADARPPRPPPAAAARRPPSPLSQSSMAPADMMLEIFRTLRVLQFEWKIVAQYSLKCRPCSHPHGGGIDPSMAVRCKVKAGPAVQDPRGPVPPRHPQGRRRRAALHGCLLRAALRAPAQPAELAATRGRARARVSIFVFSSHPHTHTSLDVSVQPPSPLALPSLPKKNPLTCAPPRRRRRAGGGAPPRSPCCRRASRRATPGRRAACRAARAP